MGDSSARMDLIINVGPLSLGLSSLLRGGVSIFLAGPSGAGKTSFKLALKRVELKELWEIETTTGNESRLVYYQVPDTPRVVPLWCYDFGGDKAYRSMWEEAMTRHLPLGIVYVLDHQNHRRRISELLRNKGLHPTRENVRQIIRSYHDDLCKITEERIQEHREYIAFLTEFLKSKHKVMKYIKVMIVVINKQDMWGEYHTLQEFQDIFRNDFMELGMGLRMPAWIPISTYENKGIQVAMRRLLQHAGREFKIFGRKFHWDKPFVE